MHLKTRNVNTAFRDLVEEFQAGERDYAGAPPVVKRPSRNGPVLMIDEPVIATYTHPRERVLFNSARDANPFFHLYEALWMLAGRNDVAPLAYYAKNIANYSDDGKTLNGAYGYRWRSAHVMGLAPVKESIRNLTVRGLQNRKTGRIPTTSTSFDSPHAVCLDWHNQLDILVNHLKADPTSRRAVLQMWNVEDDLLKIGPGDGTSKDVCCNLSVMFSLREEGLTTERSLAAKQVGFTESGAVILQLHEPRKFLDMTVTNRSNDLVWGMLGGDFVHFSFLQEYVAARLGVEVGAYHQFTNNLHAYEWNWRPEEWLKAYDDYADEYDRQRRPYELSSPPEGWRPYQLVVNPLIFEAELPQFVEMLSGQTPPEDLTSEWQEAFFAEVAGPLLVGHAYYKAGNLEAAFDCVGHCQADDWAVAATEWLQRRVARRQEKGGTV